MRAITAMNEEEKNATYNWQNLKNLVFPLRKEKGNDLSPLPATKDQTSLIQNQSSCLCVRVYTSEMISIHSTIVSLCVRLCVCVCTCVMKIIDNASDLSAVHYACLVCSSRDNVLFASQRLSF